MSRVREPQRTQQTRQFPGCPFIPCEFLRFCSWLVELDIDLAATADSHLAESRIAASYQSVNPVRLPGVASTPSP